MKYVFCCVDFQVSLKLGVFVVLFVEFFVRCACKLEFEILVLKILLPGLGSWHLLNLAGSFGLLVFPIEILFFLLDHLEPLELFWLSFDLPHETLLLPLDLGQFSWNLLHLGSDLPDLVVAWIQRHLTLFDTLVAALPYLALLCCVVQVALLLRGREAISN